MQRRHRRRAATPLTVSLASVMAGVVTASVVGAAAGCARERGAPDAASATRVRDVARAPVQRFTDPDRARKVAAIAAQLEAEIDAEALPRAGDRETGLAFVFVVDDAIVARRARGLADVEEGRPATTETLFRIASVTKTFTAAAILKLRDAGALGLDDPLARHLPELEAARYPHADAMPVTIRQVLTHAAGLARSGPWAAREPSYRSTEADVLAAARELATDPGVSVRYSNVGYAVLGLLVARKANVRYRDFVARELLAPLGMRSTTFEPFAPTLQLAAGYVGEGAAIARAPAIANGAAEAAGGLWSSASDLATWVRMQLAAWPPRDEPERGPVRRASLRESHAPAMTAELESDDAGVRVRSMGLAWKVERSCDFLHLVEHGGDLGGYRARLVLAPDRGFGFVLLANAAAAPIDAVQARVLRVVAASGALEARAPGEESAGGDAGAGAGERGASGAASGCVR